MDGSAPEASKLILTNGECLTSSRVLVACGLVAYQRRLSGPYPSTGPPPLGRGSPAATEVASFLPPPLADDTLQLKRLYDYLIGYRYGPDRALYLPGGLLDRSEVPAYLNGTLPGE